MLHEPVATSATGDRRLEHEGPTQASEVEGVQVMGVEGVQVMGMKGATENVGYLDGRVPVDLAVASLRSAVLDELHRP